MARGTCTTRSDADTGRPTGRAPRKLGDRRWAVSGRRRADVRAQVLGRQGVGVGDEIGRGPLEDDRPAVVARAGTDVDDPVGVRHDGLVVLDDDDAVARLDEPVEQGEHVLDVGEVQPGRRLIQHVDRALLRHRDRELEALALAARERVERLAERDVAEAHVDHAHESGVGRTLGEEVGCLDRRHREHLGDVLAVEPVLEHVVAEPRAVAQLAEGLDRLREAEAS